MGDFSPTPGSKAGHGLGWLSRSLDLAFRTTTGIPAVGSILQRGSKSWQTSGLLTQYTPTDQSGASLSLTVVRGNYCLIGKLVNVVIEVTYPTTADGSQAKVLLPFTSAVDLFGFCYVSALTTPGNARITPSTNYLSILNQASSAFLTNANLSGATILFNGVIVTT